MGHAVFDTLNVPLFGQPEDAADEFSTYMMLSFGKQDARRLIHGAAYGYKDYVRNPKVTVPLQAFSDAHGAPMQRFYNLLCIAYGADQETFGDLIMLFYQIVLSAGANAERIGWNPDCDFIFDEQANLAKLQNRNGIGLNRTSMVSAKLISVVT